MNGNFTGFEPPDDWVSTPKTRSATADDDAKAAEADLDREIEEEDEKNAPPDVAPRPAPSQDVVLELTGVAKASGILSKRITLNPDGSVKADGSACTMASGGACRLRFDAAHLQAFADTIAALEPHEAITLGALRPDLPEQVRIVTKNLLNKLKGTSHLDRGPSSIARTSDAISYRPAEPGLALLDIDVKKMPTEVRGLVMAHGGYWAALTWVMPDLKTCGRVVRGSTSAGLYRTDTGEKLPGSENRHVYVPVLDGTDIKRFLKALHDRLWLAELGWMEVSRSGQLLERSLIDRNVYSPERLVFEGAPILAPPLAQDPVARVPTVTSGGLLDTRTACTDLTLVP